MTLFMLASILADGRVAPAALRQLVRDQLHQEVFNRFPALRIAFYDARSFQSRCSDVLVWDVRDVAEYNEAVALLESIRPRNAEIVIVDVIPAAEVRHEDATTCPLVGRSLLDVGAGAA